jgi:hypothetical protein
VERQSITNFLICDISVTVRLTYDYPTLALRIHCRELRRDRAGALSRGATGVLAPRGAHAPSLGMVFGT